MKKILILFFCVMMITACTANAELPGPSVGAKIGTLKCIGMTEEDVKQWTSDIAAAEGKETPYVNNHTIIFYDNLQTLMMALSKGEIDRISIGDTTARYIAEHNENFVYADRKHNAVLGYSIAMLSENRMDDINRAIAAMQEDGTIEALSAKYIENPADTESVAMPVIEGADTIRIAVTGDMPPMDVILEDGTPAGFNTAFLAELSRYAGVNFELVSVASSARAVALSSGVVDALFWTRGVYDENGDELPYPLDRMEGIVVSRPYFRESRSAVYCATR